MGEFFLFLIFLVFCLITEKKEMQFFGMKKNLALASETMTTVVYDHFMVRGRCCPSKSEGIIQQKVSFQILQQASNVSADETQAYSERRWQNLESRKYAILNGRKVSENPKVREK
jgi:hypothetical protein